MRILASDYDGTLYAHNELLGDVVQAVSDWRNAGNRFGIVTGRDFSMIRPEIERWNIPVDFLVCINGAAVYNADFSLQTAHLIDDETVPLILQHPAGLASLHYQLSGLEPLRVYLRPGSLFWDAGIRFDRLEIDQAMAATNIGQISLAYKTDDESAKWTDALNAQLGGSIQAHRNKRMLDITRNGVDKASGIARVLAANNWPADCVHTVGDGENDLAMLSAYDGCTVTGAAPDVVKAARKQYENVPELIAALLG